MEIKIFKKQSDFDQYVNDLKKTEFYKLLEQRKGIFKTTIEVFCFNEKDVENYVSEKFYQIIETLGIKDYKDKIFVNEKKVYIKLNCEHQNDFLLQRHGKLVSSIQNLLSSYLSAKFYRWYSVSINVNNHLHNQKYFFKKQIYNAIKEIEKNNEPFHFRPMLNDQRKMVHEIVKNIVGYKSYSEGKGHLRHIVIDVEKIEKKQKQDIA